MTNASVFAHRTALHGTSALAAVAMLIGTSLGLSTLITPLYLIYQQQFGFSQITLTLIYAAYGGVAALYLARTLSGLGVSRRGTPSMARSIPFRSISVRSKAMMRPRSVSS